MVALSAAAGIDDRGRVFLDGLDLLRVRRLATTRAEVAGEDQRSWLVDAGLRRVLDGGRARTEGYVRGGLGVAGRLAPGVVSYLMVETDLGTGPDVVSLEPSVGLVAGAGAWKGWLRGGLALSAGRQAAEARAALDLRWRLTERLALRLGLELRGDRGSGLVGVHQAW
jgi:hypothetical protein